MKTYMVINKELQNIEQSYLNDVLGQIQHTGLVGYVTAQNKKEAYHIAKQQYYYRRVSDIQLKEVTKNV